MGSRLSLIRKLFGLNIGISNDVTPTPEALKSEIIDEIPVPTSINWKSLVNV